MSSGDHHTLHVAARPCAARHNAGRTSAVSYRRRRRVRSSARPNATCAIRLVLGQNVRVYEPALWLCQTADAVV
jgi:hypothetical protein